VFYLVLACVFGFSVGARLLGEVNWIVTQLITKGGMVLRLQDSRLSDLTPYQCVALGQNQYLP